VRNPGGYRIVDEPAPTGLEQLIVNPIWPLLGSMFAGAWLAYPWFVLNAFALGGRRRWGDLAIAAAGITASALTLFVMAALLGSGFLDETTLPYAQLVPVGVRLTCFYWLFLRQEQVFGLFTYFGGQPRQALIVVVAAFFIRQKLLGEAPPVLQLLLS
jgi:hypothetical protein